MTFCIEKEKYLRTFSYFIFLRTESVQWLSMIDSNSSKLLMR
jgi:hypothetical protein